MATTTLTEPRTQRFNSHVAFDNISAGESTEYNPIAFTLNYKHAGYQWRRRHRTFMVGVDDNAYSDHALQWLLNELVDDGDEIVCVRVIETQLRLTNKAYQDDAKSLMEAIQAKNTKNHAISLILEYAVGKLHNTFQHMIKMYQPSMLIVGTKGRSLDGVQGFLVNRSSFSKYCLQYSPIPVVVVRPTEKREKKKLKRTGDPTRQTYINLLGGVKHEADSETSSLYNLEPNITADEEAHRVAVAVGLPAAYDPTIKKLPRDSVPGSSQRRSVGELPKEAPQILAKGGIPAEKPPGEDTESEDEEEEFEVESGEQLLRKEQLKSMEHNEGAALRRHMSTGSTDSDDETAGAGGAKTT
ncbi:universal stress protein [Microdochium bolleyi]|uniref:Universal stress protein n=1 Tax=Microdochium bolleyi TaxID=196109 RepID=A0A136JC00_9PEZI|nr:universal stress protein [Microdochium bolleyi]